MNPNWLATYIIQLIVVICFDFIIFALWIPTTTTKRKWPNMLWFASISLFLHYESLNRPSFDHVVICFDFIIFALWISTRLQPIWQGEWLWFASILLFLHYESQPLWYWLSILLSCDLLRFYYFCIMNLNYANPDLHTNDVVICFDFIILHYESQLATTNGTMWMSCDLLRFYYFCIMNLNRFSTSICNTMIYITD